MLEIEVGFCVQERGEVAGEGEGTGSYAQGIIDCELVEKSGRRQGAGKKERLKARSEFGTIFFERESKKERGKDKEKGGPTKFSIFASRESHQTYA